MKEKGEGSKTITVRCGFETYLYMFQLVIGFSFYKKIKVNKLL